MLWTLGVIYITYNSIQLHGDHVALRAAVPPSEEIERWSTNKRHTRLQHGTAKEMMHNRLRQVKRATTSSLSESQQNKKLSLQKTQQQPIRFDDVLSEQRQPIRLESEQIQSIRSNRIVTVEREATVVTIQKQQQQQRPTSRQLFISDKPTVVKDFLSWKEAGETHTFEEEQESKDGFARHAFNQYASDRLGYFRELPDTRHTL